MNNFKYFPFADAANREREVATTIKNPTEGRYILYSFIKDGSGITLDSTEMVIKNQNMPKEIIRKAACARERMSKYAPAPQMKAIKSSGNNIRISPNELKGG